MIEHLDALVRLAESLGYAVTYGPTPSGAPGRVCYAARRIWVDTRTPEYRLLVLAHEVGHALAAARMGYGVGTAKRARAERTRLTTGERRAYLYGWAVVRRLGLPVTREEWRSEHLDVLEEAA